jgi:hypothetical protein
VVGPPAIPGEVRCNATRKPACSGSKVRGRLPENGRLGAQGPGPTGPENGLFWGRFDPVRPGFCPFGKLRHLCLVCVRFPYHEAASKPTLARCDDRIRLVPSKSRLREIGRSSLVDCRGVGFAGTYHRGPFVSLTFIRAQLSAPPTLERVSPNNPDPSPNATLQIANPCVISSLPSCRMQHSRAKACTRDRGLGIRVCGCYTVRALARVTTVRDPRRARYTAQ